MRPALPLALMLATLALAGCAGGGSVTALEARAAADEEARSWSADAVLVSAAAIEAGNQSQLDRIRAEGSAALEGSDDPEAAAVADAALASVHADGSVGDGLAPAWLFTYMGSEGMRFIVVTGSRVSHSSSLGVVSSGFAALPAAATLAVQASLDLWKVDSDEAAAAARGVPDFATVAADPAATVAYGFHVTEGNPVWEVVAGNEFGHVSVRIDANDGTVLESEIDDGPVAPTPVAKPEVPVPPREAGDVEGTVGVAPDTQAFKLEQAHASMALRLEAEFLGVSPLPRATVTAPGGKTYELDSSGTLYIGSGSVVVEGSADPVPAGEWQVEVATTVPIPTGYVFSWCTDGGGSAGSRAC
jgi:hypothetical protein